MKTFSLLLLMVTFLATNGAAETDLLDLASGAVMLSFTSEYSDGWGALLLIDGSASTGWCNAKPNPNTFVIELPGSFNIDKIVLDNSGNQEASYTGISARLVDVFASTSGDSGYQKIGTFEAAKGARKVFPINNVKAQWLKFVVLSNWGNKEYTELMELEAYGIPAGPAKQADLSGVYDSNYGPIVLKKTGNSVVGCYYGGSGSFNGTTDGRTLQLEWRQDQGKSFGPLLMALSSDGTFLNGLWYRNESSAPGRWFAHRMNAEAPCTPGATNAVADALHASGRTVLYGIQFDSDSAAIKPQSEATLQEVAEALKKDATMKIEVGGHTDSVNTDDYNLQLSSKRAAAVVDWLIKHGLDSGRLSSKGYGKSKPVADNATPQGRALNRRVELVVLK